MTCARVLLQELEVDQLRKMNDDADEHMEGRLQGVLDEKAELMER